MLLEIHPGTSRQLAEDLTACDGIPVCIKRSGRATGVRPRRRSCRSSTVAIHPGVPTTVQFSGVALCLAALIVATSPRGLTAQQGLGEHEDHTFPSPSRAVEQPSSPLLAAPLAFESGRDYGVRIVYLIPSNREPQPDAEKVIQRHMLRVQTLFGENMARLGHFGRTFGLETGDGHGPPIVHIARVPEPDTAFHDLDYVGMWGRILNGVSRAGYVPFLRGQALLVIAETHRMLSDGTIQAGTNFVGGTGTQDGQSGVAVVTGDFLARMTPALLVDDRQYGGLTIPALGPFPLVQGVSFPGFEGSTVSSTSSSAQGAAAHELAHAFALPHDFRNDENFNGNLLGNGLRGFRGFFHPDRYPQDDVRLSSGSALQLNFSRFFFEIGAGDFTAPSVQIVSSGTIVPVNGHLRVGVRVTDDTQLAAIVLVRNGNAVADMSVNGRFVDTTVDAYDFTPGVTDQWEVIAFDAAGNRSVSPPVMLTAATGFNRAAVPNISVGSRRVSVGESVLLDARRAFDPDGSPSLLQVEWDLDGDGDFDTLPSTNRMLVTSFSEPGTFQVIARLTDAAGDTSVSMPIGVHVVPALVNHLVTLEQTTATAFTSDGTGCPSGYAGKLSFDATLTNVGGQRLLRPAVEIATITSGNLLLVGTAWSVTGENELLEESQSFSALGATTLTLLPGESKVVPFTVCMEQKAPFQLFVNVRGATLESDDSDPVRPPR